jgi:hypothetical protein
MTLIAIDPANIESAYCVMDTQYKPLEFGKIPNKELLYILQQPFSKDAVVAIEMIASYGMAVGKEVFETCLWIGRYIQAAETAGGKVELIYRKDVKMNLCGSMRAKDTNIRQALIDRFGIVGTKGHQGFFYGFKADIWAAYAVGCTYLDKILIGGVE